MSYQRLLLPLLLAGALSACSSLPQAPQRPTVYDLGISAAPAQAAASQPLAPIVLAEVLASGQRDGSSAMLYRLAYANAQQLHPYAQARWSLPPAQLLQQALAGQLGRHRPVLTGAAGMQFATQAATPPDVLHVELEEFSQVFDSPASSHGLLRLRASLLRPGAAGDRLLGQRQITLTPTAPTPDAPGGALALAEATRQAAQALHEWLAQTQSPR